jgi:tetratricopeptide (TPR) repeat protein
MKSATARGSQVQTDPESPQGLIERADHLIGVRRYSEALPWLTRALAAEPQNARAHCFMALAFLSLGEPTKALAAGARAVAADPEDEWPHRLCSIAHHERGKRRAALESAREAVRLGPDVPEALFTLVRAQLACRQRREAAETADHLATVAPGEALMHRALGDVAMARRDWRAAETHFRRAVARDPESYVALNNLGLVLHRLGRAQEAIERFHEAARANPTAGEARENLIGAVRRFLQPNVTFLTAGIAIGAFARATSFQPVVASVLLAGWVAGYLAWRKRRLQRLPLGAAAVYTNAGAWNRRPFTPATRVAAAYRRLRPRR